MLLSPALAGEFGKTVQYFAQYGIGGPAETAFTIHDPGNVAILVEVELINSDGALFQNGGSGRRPRCRRDCSFQ